MGFWGIEVRPGKPFKYQFSDVQGRVQVTQATLGSGDCTERSALQCSVGDSQPVFLCSLLPNKIECCPLNLEFEEDDVISFKVVGSRSIHLSGILLTDDGNDGYDDSDSYGEDIAETESEESSEYDSEDEYDEDFINDGDFDMMPPSPARKSGVVIEEIDDDDKPTNGDNKPQRSNKNKSSDSGDNRQSKLQIVANSGADFPVLESEDEDGFPVSSSRKNKHANETPDAEAQNSNKADNTKAKGKNGGDETAGVKRKVEDGQSERQKKKKKKQNQKEQGKEGKTDEVNESNQDVEKHEKSKVLPSKSEDSQKPVLENEDIAHAENGSEKKKKKKKKNKKGQDDQDTNTDKDQTVSATGDRKKSSSKTTEKQSEEKPSQVRSFPNGLVIEEMAMGKPDGKKAAPGKTVTVRYIGKLQKNGKIFDSNVGRHPFKFRLGVGQVIKGWDVGVNGMRIGDKRRLTIPPAMGYGAKGAGKVIPPNAWLVFDVELIDVK